MSYLGRIPERADFTKLDDISSSFNGVLREFSLTVSGDPVNIASPKQCIISLNGVIQEPGVGFTIGSTSNKILFDVAPQSGDEFFGIIIARAYTLTALVGTVSSLNLDDGSVTANKIFANAVTESKINASAVTNAKIADNAVTLQKIQDNAVIPSKISTTVNVLGALGGGTHDINLNSGRIVTATVDTSETTFTFSNPKSTGNKDEFLLILENGGSQTVNWPVSISWAEGIAPLLKNSGVDQIKFTTIDGGVSWLGKHETENTIFREEYISADTAIGATGAVQTFSHGLSVSPKLFKVSVVCQTAELGYSIGDEVHIVDSYYDGNLNYSGLTVSCDNTNITIANGVTFTIRRKDTGAAAAGITKASWRFRVRAWA